MKASKLKTERRERRKQGIRKRLQGSADMPRLTVYRSLKHIYAQLIDDDRGITLCAVNTKMKSITGEVKDGGNIAAAKIIGSKLAEAARAKGIERVCFDRNGYRFHGRVKGLADAAREGGLKF